MKTSKNLVYLISRYFDTFHACIIKEEYDYLNTDPPNHKRDRCSSSAYVILRLLVGKLVYQRYKQLDALQVTRQYELENGYDSLYHLHNLKSHLLKKDSSHQMIAVKIVRYFDGKLYTEQQKTDLLPCHYFIIEKKSNRSTCLYNLYQSYADHYTLNEFMKKVDTSLSSEQLIDFFLNLEYIFSSKKWDKTCSSIWKSLFFYKLPSKIIGLPISNRLFFTFQVYSLSRPKQVLSSFISKQLSNIKMIPGRSLFDLPSLYKYPINTTVKIIRTDLTNANKDLSLL